MKVFVFFLCLISSTITTRLLSSDELHKLFLRVVNKNASETDLSVLQEVFEIYGPASTAIQNENENSRKGSITCLICRSALGAFFHLVRGGATDEKLIDAIHTMCSSLRILRYESCRSVLELNIPILTYIIKTTPEAAPTTFCGLVLQEAGDPNTCVYDDARFKWTVDLPERPDVRRIKVSKIDKTPLTIALITDAHIDPLYEPNGVADCNEPTCCRKGQKPRTVSIENDVEESIFENAVIETDNDILLDLDVAKEIKSRKKIITGSDRNSPPAGYWGDYRNCDSPIWAYDDVIERIAETHKNIDVVYYMGDNIDHHVWETTYEMINEVNAYVIDKMRKEFGDNVLIVPSIANHESQPTNQFAPSTVTGKNLNTTWLYDSLAKKWDFYLTEDAKVTLRKMGAFSMLIRPGLRVISVNTNIAYRYNWWLMYDPEDGKRHLEWLINELYKAELAAEKVHILGHIPPGVHDLTHTWTREYNRIINRFSSIIAGEFNGHTHPDEFRIFYNLEDGSPINVAWGAGCATAYTFYNLNYKIATFDPITFEPRNILNYVYNLTEANLTPNKRPRWFQLYDMKDTFGLRDLSAKSMDNLVTTMVTSKRPLLDLYAKFSSKQSDVRWPACDDNCKIDRLCKTVITVLWDQERCNELRRLFFY